MGSNIDPRCCKLYGAITLRAIGGVQAISAVGGNVREAAAGFSRGFADFIQVRSLERKKMFAPRLHFMNIEFCGNVRCKIFQRHLRDCCGRSVASASIVLASNIFAERIGRDGNALAWFSRKLHIGRCVLKHRICYAWKIPAKQSCSGTSGSLLYKISSAAWSHYIFFRGTIFHSLCLLIRNDP